jgi:hypothetical protein
MHASPAHLPRELEKPILAIDPGTVQSAWLLWDGHTILGMGLEPNTVLLARLSDQTDAQELHIEMVASYGMPVGKTVFETVLWIGRFVQIFEGQGKAVHLVYRQAVKLHHCRSVRAKDSNIRQALIDKYGEPGTKKNPGLTYGLKKDLWSAFAIATFVAETRSTEPTMEGAS